MKTDSEEKAQNIQNSQEDVGHWLKEAIPNSQGVIVNVRSQPASIENHQVTWGTWLCSVKYPREDNCVNLNGVGGRDPKFLGSKPPSSLAVPTRAGRVEHPSPAY